MTPYVEAQNVPQRFSQQPKSPHQPRRNARGVGYSIRRLDSAKPRIWWLYRAPDSGEVQLGHVATSDACYDERSVAQLIKAVVDVLGGRHAR